MKLCMIGTGYVGLVSGVCFSDLGNEVICVDKDSKKTYLKNNDAISKRLNEQIKNGNIKKKENKYILTNKGLSMKKSFIIVTKLFNINDILIQKR